jgi:hypothetical protein
MTKSMCENMVKWIDEGMSPMQAAEKAAPVYRRKSSGIIQTFRAWIKEERAQGRDPVPSMRTWTVQKQEAPKLEPQAQIDNGTSKDLIHELRKLLLADVMAERDLLVEVLEKARIALAATHATIEEIIETLEILTNASTEQETKRSS